MKKAIRSVSAIFTILCLTISFSACSLFASMREYSKKATEIQIISTPDEKAIFEEFDHALEISADEAIKLSYSAGYDVKNTSVTGENDNTDILNKASNTVKTLIMNNKPGAESNESDTVSLAGTLLEQFDSAASLSYTAARNEVNESVTNEKGEEMTDESGSVIKEPKIKDNFLLYSFCFYEDTVTQEASTDENGKDIGEVTERSFADKAVIESVFGAPKDKETVLSAFDSLKDYFTVNEYSYEYGSCKVSGQLDLETDRLLNADFEKEMLITAKVTGVGIFEEYGELTVTFNLIRNDNYTFSYSETEE